MPIWSSRRLASRLAAGRRTGLVHGWHRWLDWRCSALRPASLPPPAHKLRCWPDGPCRASRQRSRCPALAAVDTSAAPERRGAAIGAWTGFLMLGFSIGPLLGGALTHITGWRVIFWLNVADVSRHCRSGLRGFGD